MLKSIYLDSLQLFGPGTAVNYVMLGFKGLGTPPPRTDRSDRSRRHGMYDLSTYYSGRKFTGDLWVRPDNKDGETDADWATFWTAYNTLMEELGYGVPGKTLTFTRKGLTYSEFCEVTVDEDIEPEWPSAVVPLCKIPFVVVAADPRIYATALSSASGSGTFTATNNGNFNTSPLITLTGAGTASIINGSLSTENEIHVDGGGGTVVIDCLARTVKLGGVLRPDILDPSNSSFWGLRKGANSITVSGASATVEWHDARIG